MRQTARLFSVLPSGSTPVLRPMPAPCVPLMVSLLLAACGKADSLRLIAAPHPIKLRKPS